MGKCKVITIINYIVSGILWLLGVLTLLFNIFGLWELWQFTGFCFLLYISVPLVSQIIAIVFSCTLPSKKYIIMNLISVAVSVGVALFTLFVSTWWFW